MPIKTIGKEVRTPSKHQLEKYIRQCAQDSANNRVAIERAEKRIVMKAAKSGWASKFEAQNPADCEPA